MHPLGIHVLAEITSGDPTLLDDPHYIETSLLELANTLQCTVLTSNFHHFEPQGVTGIIAISESHISIHTWPEHSYAAVDVFTCSTSIDPYSIIRFLKSRIPGKYQVTVIYRGVVDG